MRIHYLYITSAPFDNGVYQTQVIDWLNLYREKGLDFSLIQLFTIHPTVIKKAKSDRKSISNSFSGKVIFHWRLPQRILPPVINKVLFLLAVRPLLKKKEDKVVIFSRSHIACEIEYLRRFYPDRVTYYYDLRGAFPEEYKDTLKFNNSYSKKTGRNIGDIYYSSYCCQKEANKIFSVSHSLMEYYKNEFGTDENKFVLYPCLSTSSKFYYKEELRKGVRAGLGINEDEKVFLYSGGLDYSYSFVEEFVSLFKEIIASDSKAKLLVLAKKITPRFLSIIDKSLEVKSRLLTVENIPNQEMVKYLNAADYGFLLRNNTILNNVASPVKFAEYQLCGLPVLISEAVTDYATYCKENNTGVIVSNREFEQRSFKDVVNEVYNMDFDRKRVAQIAKENLSKEGYVDTIVKQLIINSKEGNNDK